MHSKVTSTFVLTSLLSAANAFVPFKIEPLPSDFDTRVWSPVTTITPSPATITAIPSEQITPAPVLTPEHRDEEILNIQTIHNPDPDSDLRKRQGVQQAVAASFTQISPITTYQINLYRSGTVTQLNVVYTQTFAPIPDQWPSPTLAGTIGLGTIQGEVGVVKSKRSLPTQAPLAPLPEGAPTQHASPPESTATNEELLELISKLRKAGKEATDGLSTLMHKVKKPSLKEIEDEIASLVHKMKKPSLKEFEDSVSSLVHKVKKPSLKDIEEEIISMAKKLRLPGSGDDIPAPNVDAKESDNPFNFGGGKQFDTPIEYDEPFSFGGGAKKEELPTKDDEPFSFGGGKVEELPTKDYEPFTFGGGAKKEELPTKDNEPFTFGGSDREGKSVTHQTESQVANSGAQGFRIELLVVLTIVLGTICLTY